MKLPYRANGILIMQPNHLIQLGIACRTLPFGSGDFYFGGKFSPNIFTVLDPIITALQEYDEFYSKCDFNIQMENTKNLPLAGPSIGLPLAMALMSAADRYFINPKYIFTGEVKSDGSVISVGEIQKKRRAASYWGYDRLYLPSSQIDHNSSSITQAPVKNIFECAKRLSHISSTR